MNYVVTHKNAHIHAGITNTGSAASKIHTSAQQLGST